MSWRSTRRALCGVAVAGALCGAIAAGAATAKPPARKPVASAKPAAGVPARKPIDAATSARVLEEQGNYAGALGELKALRAMQGPDADVELMLALDEARVGQVDSAWARLHTPLLDAALADTAGRIRRTEYPFQREGILVNGKFDGWYWYVARARAELALRRRDWAEAVSMASRAAAARPLSGKEALLLAVAASQAGDAQLGEAAASWASYLEPWLPEAHFLSGLWAWRGGRRAEARAQLETAAALDSNWREPALALARLRLPGLRADSLPTRFLTGVRSCAMLTSAKRPKQEEFVQFDSTPMLAFNPQTQPDDSLRAAMHLKKPAQVYVQVLVSESGHPLMAELPWITESDVPAGVIHHVLDQVGGWRFVPALKFGKPQRSWASVEYVLQP
jgi:tetratricopeptide (TPR) repeat protein